VVSAGVEARVEDGDLKAARAIGVQQAAENLRDFFPAEAAGVAVVDGRHQVIVENIDVEVHPESLDTWTGDRGQSFPQGAGRAACADFRAVNDRDGRVANVLGENVVVVAEHAVADQRDVLVPDECLRGTWREAITAITRRTRDVLMAHPWSLASLNEAQFGPNAMRHFEQSLAAVAGTGLALPARFELIAAVDDYVSGNALHAVESLARAKIAAEDPAMVAAAVAYGIARLQTGEFPQLSAIAAGSTQTAEPPGPPMTEAALTGQFERGLQALLDGLAARMNLS
jgi:hypothetical protein